MVSVVQDAFTRYSFTDDELEQACVFTPIQVMHLRTEVAIAMAEKAGKSPLHAKSVEAYLQEQEYYRGKAEAVAYLLSVHEATVEIINSKNNPKEA